MEPSNVEAEESVLGACFLSENAVDRVAEHLDPSDFYRDGHATLFATLLAMRRRGDPIDALVVAAELERLSVLDKVGGKARLAELAGLAISVSNVEHYAHLVVEAARARSVYRTSLAIQAAATNGGLALHPELLDEMQVAIDNARTLPGEPGAKSGPVFITAHDFASRTYAPPEPLLGTDDVAIIARGSFNLLAGRPGTGKTTLLLDMVCHLAAGIPWPPADGDRAPNPWPVPKPLRIGIIENEGPQEMFKSKVQDKLERFPHSIRDAGGEILIHTLHWGAFSFADRALVERARKELDEHEVDLIVGDPLASLGLEGVGSPAETMAFIQQLRPLGLGTSRAFLFLHHFRERAEKTDDEMSRISGAWGGHLDTLITLSATGKPDHARFNYAKLRWNRGVEVGPVILGRVFNTRSFEALAEESDVGLLEPAVASFLEGLRAGEQGKGGLGWATETDIAKAVGARRTSVTKCLEGAPHLFARASTEMLAELKARANSKLWGLVGWDTAAPARLEEGDFAGDDVAQTAFGDTPDDGIPF